MKFKTEIDLSLLEEYSFYKINLLGVIEKYYKHYKVDGIGKHIYDDRDRYIILKTHDSLLCLCEQVLYEIFVPNDSDESIKHHLNLKLKTTDCNTNLIKQIFEKKNDGQNIFYFVPNDIDELPIKISTVENKIEDNYTPQIIINTNRDFVQRWLTCAMMPFPLRNADEKSIRTMLEPKNIEEEISI